MASTITYKFRVEGLRETIRAFRDLPKDANNELRDRTLVLAQTLAEQVRAAGMADGPQSARAAESVKAQRDRVPVIKAGGTKRSSAVVFGSEFGMNRRSGWYAARRYNASDGRQYRPHEGRHSYWFFRTVEDNEGEIAAAWRQVADDVLARWAT
jgi:hypothetical protein